MEKIFRLVGENGLFKYGHGTRIRKQDSLPGDIPLITAGSMNNGINRYIKKPIKNKIFNDCITIDMFGNVFYQKGKFVCDDNIYPIWPIKNEKIGLFLSTIISKKLKNNYQNQFREKILKKFEILLPVDKNGNPDWEYMEKSVKELEKSVKEKLKLSIPQLDEIDTNDWKEFKISDILTRIKIKSISSVIKKFNPGAINVIGNTQLNNGIIKSLNVTEEIYIHDKNSLSYGAKGGKFFYQKEKWASTDHVHMFKCKFINEINAQFLCTVINKLIEAKGGWSTSLESNIIHEHILLPVDKNGNPDWEYMEKSVKELEKSVKEKLKLSIPQLDEIDTNDWKEFKISDILTRIKIKSISSVIKKFNPGAINVIGNTQLNNGIIKSLNVTEEIYIHDKNSLSYGAKGGKFFYQKEKWASTDHVHMFKCKFINEINAQFLCTVINKLIEAKGGWSTSLESNIIHEHILLPVDKNGNPDWEYMEKYMKPINEIN